MNKSFKERLISLRKEKGLTQDKFAELMGVSKSAISMYENGNRTPDFELEEKIADYFNVDLDYLRGRSNIRNRYQLENENFDKNLFSQDGQKLKNRRLELNLTLEEVGNIVGVTKSTVRKWETGAIENMKRDKISLLAKALQVSPEFITGTEDAKTIGEKIKERREKLGLSQEQLAERLGYKSKTSIHKVEQGITDLPLSKLSEFAKALNTTSSYLMEWDEEKSNLTTNDTPLSSKELQKLEEKKLIKDLSSILEKNSACSLGEIKRGNKVDVIKNGEILKTYDVELILKAYEIKYLKDKFSLEDIEELENRFSIPEDLKGISRKQYIKFMGESAMFFDDDSISEETKDKLLLSFQRMFYDAKEKNRRKK